MTDKEIVLSFCEVNLWILNGGEEKQILQNVDLSIRAGESWGIVGESGAGKSMMMYVLTALLYSKSTRITGQILFTEKDGQKTDILRMPPKERRRYCSARTAVILQDSINALNPYVRIGRQWGETVLKYHGKMDRQAIKHYLLDRQEQFGIIGGEEVLKKYHKHNHL